MKSASEVLAAALDRAGGLGALPMVLCEDCAEVLPVGGVGLALMTDAGHQGVIAATDGPARLMEDLQFALGEGPCIDASRDHQPILLRDLAATAVTRWPHFGPAALDAGVAAIFAFPLHVGHVRLGILDLYRTRRGSLDDDQLAQALAFADAAVLVLLHLQGHVSDGADLHPQLGEPVDDRAEVHQATGVIAVQAHVGIVEALLLLRAHAHTANRPILDVSRDVLAHTLRFLPEGSEDNGDRD